MSMFDLTPDFDALVNRFTQEAEQSAGELSHLLHPTVAGATGLSVDGASRAAALVNTLVASLNIAYQSRATEAHKLRFEAALTVVLNKVNRTQNAWVMR